MAIFDGRLIDPSESDLARALGKAMNAANRENEQQTNRISRDGAFWRRFAQDVLRSGGEGRRRSSKGGRTVPEVIAGWWTDPAGRKHVRILGRTRHRWSRFRRESELRALPPWWHVYPEAVLGVRDKKGNERYLAVCRCGAVGAPGSLGWMGDTCGPCFDRRAEGGTAAGGFGQFGGWSAGLSRVAFTADGQHLIGQNKQGALWKVNRADGSAETAKRKSVNTVVATGRNDDGIMFVFQEGSVFRWRADDDTVELVIAGRRMWGRSTITPDASRVVIISYQQSDVADLTASRPVYTTLGAQEGIMGVGFTPTGRLLGVNYLGQIRALDPETLASEIIRSDEFNTTGTGFGPPVEMAVSPDGAAVLLRRESYYPRRSVSVRHVPLPRGKIVELRIPDWHRATTFAYSTDGRYAVTAEAEGGWVGFWDVSSGKSLGFVRAVLEDLAWRSGQIEFAPDGTAIAVSYSTGRHDHGSKLAVWPWPDVLQAAGEEIGRG